MEKELNKWYEKSFVKINKALSGKTIMQINKDLKQHYNQTHYEIERIKKHKKTIQIKTVEKYLKYFNLEV